MPVNAGVRLLGVSFFVGSLADVVVLVDVKCCK